MIVITVGRLHPVTIASDSGRTYYFGRLVAVHGTELFVALRRPITAAAPLNITALMFENFFEVERRHIARILVEFDVHLIASSPRFLRLEPIQPQAISIAIPTAA